MTKDILQNQKKMNVNWGVEKNSQYHVMTKVGNSITLNAAKIEK